MSTEDDKQLARQEMQRNLSAASQVSQMKQSVMKGKTFKTRLMDRAMEPTFMLNDQIEVGGAVTMNLKANDLLYVHYDNGFHLRRIVKQATSTGEMSFIVRGDADDGLTWTIASNQIIGKVVSANRNGEPLRLAKPRPPASNALEKALYWAQDQVELLKERLDKKTP
jgi:hypothetical protein